MGASDGGTIEDWARSHVDICFTFVPKGTKKSIDDIFKERNITNESMKNLCRQEADRMASYPFLYSTKEDIFVFSKDNNGYYSWEKATLKDRFNNFWTKVKKLYGLKEDIKNYGGENMGGGGAGN